MFEVNFWGVTRVLQEGETTLDALIEMTLPPMFGEYGWIVLPMMRKARRGHIISVRWKMFTMMHNFYLISEMRLQLHKWSPRSTKQ
jgi:hypothetical protein